MWFFNIENVIQFVSIIMIYFLCCSKMHWSWNPHASNTISIVFFVSYFQLTCTECKRPFRTPKSLNKHTRIAHAEVRTLYDCDACASVLGQLCSLKEHYERVHGTEKSVEFCKSRAREETEEESRLRNEKMSQRVERKVVVKKFTCPICQTKCTGKSNLKRHAKRHDVPLVPVTKSRPTQRGTSANRVSIHNALLQTKKVCVIQYVYCIRMPNEIFTLIDVWWFILITVETYRVESFDHIIE